MGSGSLAAMSVLEDAWKPNMTEEEAKKCVRDAIASGILSDGYSGSQARFIHWFTFSKLYLHESVENFKRLIWLSLQRTKLNTSASTMLSAIRASVLALMALLLAPLQSLPTRYFWSLWRHKHSISGRNYGWNRGRSRRNNGNLAIFTQNSH